MDCRNRNTPPPIRCWLIALLLAMATPLRAAAQEPIDRPGHSELSTLFASPGFRNNMLDKIGRPVLAAGTRSVLGHQAVSPARYVADLNYYASPGISRTLGQQIASSVVDADPGQTRHIRELLASGRVWQRFDRVLSGTGYSSRNLADVMAWYYVTSWEIINEQDAPPALYRAVRDQIAESLHYSPEVLFMSNAEKQRVSESIGIMCTIVDDGSQQLRDQGDQIGYLAVQNAVRESLLEQGLDMKRLRLTRRGFSTQ